MKDIIIFLSIHTSIILYNDHFISTHTEYDNEIIVSFSFTPIKQVIDLLKIKSF